MPTINKLFCSYWMLFIFKRTVSPIFNLFTIWLAECGSWWLWLSSLLFLFFLNEFDFKLPMKRTSASCWMPAFNIPLLFLLYYFPSRNIFILDCFLLFWLFSVKLFFYLNYLIFLFTEFSPYFFSPPSSPPLQML